MKKKAYTFKMRFLEKNINIGKKYFFKYGRKINI